MAKNTNKKNPATRQDLKLYKKKSLSYFKSNF